ncbi:MFS transporter [Aliidongia dinghuensis]|uniref:MFS transporter n=1 Tax=Aliidongia dinghuensis TaxID=1867774 RepID=A0A8J2YTN3_9PROT|nr:MFS transporter [Aliidongia dinghuensis]GGF20282.1 MFS transporter [Aliidongia dinghuensis]
MAITPEIDVHEELATADLGPFHKTLGMLITLVTLFDGYDTFNPAYVIHYVMKPWGLAPGQAGLLVSFGLIGFLVGAVGQGMIADRIGRRVTLIGGLWIVNLFTLATALFADSFWSYCGLRFLTGLGLGVLLPLGATYINELAPRRISNRFSLWGVTLGWSLGGMLAGLAGVFLTPVYGWPALYYVGALSLPLTLVIQRVLPESPRFLAQRGRSGELSALLGRLRPERRALYADAVFVSHEAAAKGNPVAVLLSARYRRPSVTIWLTAFMSLFAIFGLTGWIPTVMMQRGESFAASFGFGALMQAMSFIGGLTLARFADRPQARASRYLAAWWAVGGLAVVTLVVASGHVLNLVIVALAGFCIVGAQHVFNNVTASAYDTDVRASGVGMMLGVGRLGAILGPFAAGLLQQATGGPDAVFWAIGGAAIVAALAIASLGAHAAAPAVETEAATAG